MGCGAPTTRVGQLNSIDKDISRHSVSNRGHFQIVAEKPVVWAIGLVSVRLEQSVGSKLAPGSN